MATPETPVPFTLDLPTILSLTAALSLLPIATFLSFGLIPSNKPRDRFLVFWHAYDALTHLIIEGSFLYNCFFSYTTIASEDYSAITSNNSPFLNRADRLYGAAYGTGPTARLWQEYGKADRRWLGADVTVISLELLTVILGGPAAAYICYLVYKSNRDEQQTDARLSSSSKSQSQEQARSRGKMWFIAAGLAVAELYGGFMTFAPEWLSGSHGLDTSDPMYLWVYLVFFNTLWVYVPIWVLWEAWKEIGAAFVKQADNTGVKKKV